MLKVDGQSLLGARDQQVIYSGKGIKIDSILAITFILHPSNFTR